MASARYAFYMTPDPPEEKHELTPKEKRQNYWHYHKWYYITGLAALAMVASFIYEVASQVEPDYQIGILSNYSVGDQTVVALEEHLTALADDRNGDNKIKVSVMEYVVSVAPDTVEIDSAAAAESAPSSGAVSTSPEAPAATGVDPYMQMAGLTKLTGDLQSGESMFFLTTDVEGYQRQFGAFAYNDGTAPAEEEAPDLTRMGVKWTDCATLANLPLGNMKLMDDSEGPAMQDLLQNHVLVRRVLNDTKSKKDEKADAYNEALDKFFSLLTTQTSPNDKEAIS